MPLPRRRIAALAALAALAAPLAACGDDAGSSSGADIVVTTPVLGAVVEDLVEDAADVRVLIPNGTDPHDYQPSARDIGALEGADLVVENGLDLEEGLEDALGQARGDEGRVFTATDHIDVRIAGEDDHGGEGHADEEEHDHGPEDPHFWMDPASMAAVVSALAPVLDDRLGLDLGDRAQAEVAELTALDAEVEETLAPIPEASRRLVTGHESMGYFARRYDFELVGALIPSLSSQAQASAANLAGLRRQVAEEDVPAIFTEAGTPDGVADTIAAETGVPVLEIGTHALPEDGSYATFIREAAGTVREGLTGS